MYNAGRTKAPRAQGERQREAEKRKRRLRRFSTGKDAKARCEYMHDVYTNEVDGVREGRASLPSVSATSERGREITGTRDSKIGWRMCTQRDWCSSVAVHTGGCLHENLRISTRALVCVHGDLQRHAASRHLSPPPLHLHSSLRLLENDQTMLSTFSLPATSLTENFEEFKPLLPDVVTCDSCDATRATCQRH